MPQSASFQSGQTSTVVALLYDSSFSTLRLPDLPLLPQALCSFRPCPSWILSALGLYSLWFSKERFLEEQQICGNLNMDYIFLGIYFHILLRTECCTSTFCVKYTSTVCVLHLAPVSCVKLHAFPLSYFFPFRVPGRAYGRHIWGRLWVASSSQDRMETLMGSVPCSRAPEQLQHLP